MCEYDTLDASVYNETDFWTIRSYYFFDYRIGEFDWYSDDLIDIDY